MFIPPFDAVLKVIGLTRDELKEKNEITISADFFKFLMSIAIANGEFNENGYLRFNPDVAEAVASGKLRNALQHYLEYGYFEGRRGATPDVDENWYLGKYSDVAAAIKNGNIESGQVHYIEQGFLEFRSPTASVEQNVITWRNVVNRISQ